MNQMQAFSRLQRLERYGSHRTKVLIRQNGGLVASELLEVIRANRVFSVSGARCPNCGERIEDDTNAGCVLSALVGVLRERGEHSEQRLVQLHWACNAHAMWDEMQGIVDDLADGGFSSADEAAAVATDDRCPNCNERVGEDAESGCVLGALIQVIREREEHTEEELLDLQRACDVDALWLKVGKVVDRLGSGKFSF